MKIHIHEEHRSIALSSNGFSLVFRDVDSITKGNAPKSNKTSPRCIIEFLPSKLDDYRAVPITCFGFLGLIYVKQQVFLCVITRRQEIGSVRPNDKIYRVCDVEFICLNDDALDDLVTHDNVRGIEDKAYSHPCLSLKRLLSSGSFFFSTEFDVTTSLQERGLDSQYVKQYDEKFLWNSFMVRQLAEFGGRLSPEEREVFERSEFSISLTRGFAQTMNTYCGKSPALLTLMARQACRRKGPLFGHWGTDDEGDVCNFLETELVMYTEKFNIAHTQIRGNVPLFWDLENQFLSTKLLFTRSAEATQHVFERHFENLCQRYGEVHILNALSQRGNQKELSEKYKKHLKRCGSKYMMSYTDILFSKEELNKSPSTQKKVMNSLEEAIIDLGAFCYSAESDSHVGKQCGVFYTNTFGSLGKANAIQKLVSERALHLCLKEVNSEEAFLQDLWYRHDLLWSRMGSEIKRITEGSMPSKSNKTSGFVGAVAGVSKKYMSAEHRHRQHTVDKLLGRLADQVAVTLFDPIHDFVTAELHKRAGEFVHQRQISIFTGTFNVNGEMYTGDISPWVWARDIRHDIVVIGLQEVVALTAGQMLSADPSKRQFWEKKLKKCLNSKDNYALIWGGQLGGVALLMFVRSAEADNIRNVEGSVKKTGLGGMSANKGCVAVSFDYSSTRFCFVVSHLAAGQNNVDERHQDYKTIVKGVRFSRNRTLKDHDAVVWMGDFNYRISKLTIDEVKSLVAHGEYQFLFENDQLNIQMSSGESFPYFDEMEIKFPPTYKFDNGTTTYDTSEKQRVPAWTDRIVSMSRGKILNQRDYGCVPEIIFSDHRPVFASFSACVDIVDETKKSKISQHLYEMRKGEVGDAGEMTKLEYLSEITLTHGLPPPSSDKTKWWIDGGQLVKVNLPEAEEEDVVINPNVPSNPFVPTKERIFLKKETV